MQDAASITAHNITSVDMSRVEICIKQRIWRMMLADMSGIDRGSGEDEMKTKQREFGIPSAELLAGMAVVGRQDEIINTDSSCGTLEKRGWWMLLLLVSDAAG
jgi:hypothetical protein